MWSNLSSNAINSKDASLYGPEVYSLANPDVLNELSKKTKEKIRNYRKEHKVDNPKIIPPKEFMRLSSASKKTFKCFCGGGQLSVDNVIGVAGVYKYLLKEVRDYNRTSKGSYVPRPRFISYINTELNLLLEHLAPTAEEAKAKLHVFNEINLIAKSLFPGSELIIFGSTVTGTCLPYSDINLMLRAPGDTILNLKLLAYVLCQLDLLQCFECVFQSKVPILKGVHKIKGSAVTISCNSSLDSHNYIAENIEESKFTKPLIVLLKFFLQSRDLGDTYTGGIGSYLLGLMTIFFMKNYEYTDDSKYTTTLGDVFIDWFHYWGYRSNFERNVISLTPKPSMTKRKGVSQDFSFKDPIDNSVDVGKSAFNFHMAKTAFQCAFRAIRVSERFYKEAIKHPKTPLSAEWIRSGTIIETIFDSQHPYFQHRKVGIGGKPVLSRYSIFSNKSNVSAGEGSAKKSIQSIIDGVHSLSDLSHVPYNVAALRYAQTF